MIRLIHPWNGHEAGSTFPEMGRGAARLLVERGFAEFTDPDEKLPKKPQPKPEEHEDVTTDEPDDDPAETQREDTPSESSGKRRGRKKTT